MGNCFGMSWSTPRASVSLPSADQSAPPQQTHDVFLSFRNFLGILFSTQSASVSRQTVPSADQSAPPQQKHDVFLSFRGEDTRKSFISHLYHELQREQNINTFKDDRVLEIGTNISSELLRAIQDSRLAIVVLSPNYASSTWCLDELTNILRCMGDKPRVLPIFYNVEPSDVRQQRGSFAEAFAKHKKRFRADREMQWRDALTQVANLSGFPSKENDQKFDERKLIENIVKWVRSKVHRTFTLLDSREFVGSKSRRAQVHSLLDPNADDVQFIGICGIGGIGKTITAKLIYDSISQHFDVSCFLANARDSAKQGTLVGLQKKLLLPILKDEIYQVLDELSGTYFTKSCFRNKKVLLVLDDVNESSQLKILAGEKDWFEKGSKIIITTRYERLLVDHGVDRLHKVVPLNDDEALELFSKNAFKRNEPDEGFLRLSERFLDYARGHPLALKTLGSSLFMRGEDAWNSVLYNMKKIPNPTIFDSLKISYDALEEMEKRCFLDIACFYKGMDKETVIYRLDMTYGISSRILICILVEKSLLDYKPWTKEISMHDLIQDMAFTIEKSKEHGKRTRLWNLDDFFDVFLNELGTEIGIELISLRLPVSKKVPHWDYEAFYRMPRLKLLEFANVIFSSGPDFLPNSLKIINWNAYPSKVLPQGFQSHFLTELQMTHSKLVRLWDDTKDFPSLKYMDLSNSEELVSTPDFTGVPNLEKLKFCGCKKLVEIHPSIALLKRLKRLDFFFCESLESLPSEIEMDSLDYFTLYNCGNLKRIPEFAGNMKNLSYLNLEGTAIEKIPASIERLVGLTALYLRDCENLMGLPSEICNLCSLETLDLGDCNVGEGGIPDDIGCLSSLKTLDLSGNNFVSLPDSIRCLSKLGYLSLAMCKSLEELPDLPANSQLHVNVDECTSLQRLSDPSKYWSSRFASNLYDFSFSAFNCISLVEDEDTWNNRIFSSIIRMANQWISGNSLYHSLRHIVSPGSEIPEWFNNQSEGRSLKVELPPPSCTNWMGIAFCVVFEQYAPKLTNAAARGLQFYPFSVGIQCSSGGSEWARASMPFYSIGNLESEHHWIFYLPRDKCRQEFLFNTYYHAPDVLNKCKTWRKIELYRVNRPGWPNVKKCGAHLVYKEELRKLNAKLEILKPTHEYFCEGAGTKRTGSFDDTEESPCKRLKGH